jgi:crossover junction endodeoxyribonuclease RuvC
MSTLIFAVDPGLNGAWGALDYNGNFLGTDDIPRFAKLIDGRAFAATIRKFAPKYFVIERVASMPKQGVASSFTFGCAYGMCIGLACGSNMPIHFITPTRWKQHFHLAGGDKEASRERAIQLFPAAAGFLTLKKHHGRAEALLLARFFIDKQTAGEFI